MSALRGAQVLIVEDEYVQADDFSKALLANGAHIVGPCPDIETGLTAIRDHKVDIAILDIRLADEDSYPIADELARLDIPFVFVSGYERSVLPTRYRLARHYQKPMVASELGSMISLCLADNKI